MEYLRLNECATFSDKRTKNILLESYISTENMIPNKGGICLAESIPNSKSASKYEPQDILLSNIRPYFRKIWYADREGSCSNDVLILKAQKGIDPKFLYYVLSDNNFFNYNTVTSKGTKMPRGSKKAIMKYLVPNLDIFSQRRIASILSAYDNLIENNNKRIRLLEQMAENLYKEWFVRFRFPGHEKVEFENGLPKEWSIMKLGVFIKFERGVGYGSKDIEDGENVLLSMNNIRPYGGFKRDYSRPYSGKYKEFQKVRKGDLIMSITDMTQDRRIIGYTGIVPPGKDNRIICTHLIKLSSEISHTYFLNGLFNYSNLSRIIAERATGANVLGLTADILKGVKTLLPPTELQSMYVTKVTPIIEECFSLQDANDNLARQRDLLLPRLMSGKLEV